MEMLNDPLVEGSLREVPLSKAPLERVIAQVRFPLIAVVEKREFIASFQESIRAKYPVLRHEQAPRIFVGAPNMNPVQGLSAWRFMDVEGHWRVSLTGEFLALETTTYKSRADFLERLRDVVESLDQHVGPKVVDRLGIRYIDRIRGAELDQIAKLVRSEVLGISGTAAAKHIIHSVSETKFKVGEAELVARWGRLPAGATPDPSAIEAAPEASWILDLDMYTAKSGQFSIEGVLKSAAQFAERIYTVFRWAVTKDFLQAYGGKL